MERISCRQSSTLWLDWAARVEIRATRKILRIGVTNSLDPAFIQMYTPKKDGADDQSVTDNTFMLYGLRSTVGLSRPLAESAMDSAPGN